MRASRARVIVALVVVALLYVAWRWSAFPESAQNAGAPDTMCLASRIGLPCAPE